MHGSSCTRPNTASATHKYLPREFFESAEYQRIAELARTLAGLIGEGAFVTRGGERQEIGSFKEAMKWLFDQAKKGQSIQRYKGLGEMNPEQLWETTINPETRRLLQVKIEDAVAADDIFTTLMGDQVEPGANSSRRTRCQWPTSTSEAPLRTGVTRPVIDRPNVPRGTSFTATLSRNDTNSVEINIY